MNDWNRNQNMQREQWRANHSNQTLVDTHFMESLHEVTTNIRSKVAMMWNNVSAMDHNDE